MFNVFLECRNITCHLFFKMEDTFYSPSLTSCFVCYLCGEFFKRPRILPCGHTFCSECLDKIRHDIINDDQHECNDNVSTTTFTPPSVSSPPCKSLSSDNLLSENGSVVYRNHDGGVTKGNVAALMHQNNSTCVDDTDNILSRSYTLPSPEYFGLSSKSSSTSLANDKNRNYTQSKKFPVENSPNTKSKAQKERIPSMLQTPLSVVTKSCSQCGSVLSSNKNSPKSKSPISDRSPSKNRDGHPRWNSSNSKSPSHYQPPACSFEHKHGKEMEQFVCPIPQCNYSMRVMNLARWSPKNKTVAHAVSAWRRQMSTKQDKASQTDISSNQSLLVTIPRILVDDAPDASLVSLPHRKRHTSMIDMAVHRAVTLDGVHQSGYLPRGPNSWKTYAAMVGMNILQQVLNL